MNWVQNFVQKLQSCKKIPSCFFVTKDFEVLTYSEWKKSQQQPVYSISCPEEAGYMLNSITKCSSFGKVSLNGVEYFVYKGERELEFSIFVVNEKGQTQEGAGSITVKATTYAIENSFCTNPWNEKQGWAIAFQLKAKVCSCKKLEIQTNDNKKITIKPNEFFIFPEIWKYSRRRDYPIVYLQKVELVSVNLQQTQAQQTQQAQQEIEQVDEDEAFAGISSPSTNSSSSNDPSVTQEKAQQVDSNFVKLKVVTFKLPTEYLGSQTSYKKENGRVHEITVLNSDPREFRNLRKKFYRRLHKIAWESKIGWICRSDADINILSDV
ncbi:hypothetical protein DRO29_07945, partial [Candidatus Bathyarchaeota archaeon]